MVCFCSLWIFIYFNSFTKHLFLPLSTLKLKNSSTNFRHYSSRVKFPLDYFIIFKHLGGQINFLNLFRGDYKFNFCPPRKLTYVALSYKGKVSGEYHFKPYISALCLNILGFKDAKSFKNFLLGRLSNLHIYCGGKLKIHHIVLNFSPLDIVVGFYNLTPYVGTKLLYHFILLLEGHFSLDSVYLFYPVLLPNGKYLIFL